jgi:hypothetical protein
MQKYHIKENVTTKRTSAGTINIALNYDWNQLNKVEKLFETGLTTHDTLKAAN